MVKGNEKAVTTRDFKLSVVVTGKKAHDLGYEKLERFVKERLRGEQVIDGRRYIVTPIVRPDYSIEQSLAKLQRDVEAIEAIVHEFELATNEGEDD